MMVKVLLKKNSYVMLNDGSPAKVWEAGTHEFEESVAANLVRCGQGEYVTKDSSKQSSAKK